MSPSDFTHHYHMPLLESLAGSDFPKSHARRYIQQTEDKESSPSARNQYPAAVLLGSQTDFEYDAITELIFESEKAF